MKSSKRTTESHTSKSQMGMGDYTGQAVKQKMGKSLVSQLDYSSPMLKKTKKAPLNLA